MPAVGGAPSTGGDPGKSPTGGTFAKGGALATGGNPATGGVVSTGGTTSVDFFTACIAAESKKSSNLNVAKQTGYTINAIAASVCGQSNVIACYQKGKCK
jgi:hypothetical protein